MIESCEILKRYGIDFSELDRDFAKGKVLLHIGEKIERYKTS